MKRHLVFLAIAACGGTAPPPSPPPVAPPPPPPPIVAPPPPSATQAPPSMSTARKPSPSIEESPHVMLGIPKDGDDSDDHLMDKGEFVVSYNPHLNAANWVAWKLTKDDLGANPRSPGFHSDESLPKDFYVVKDADYKGSGYDRGHLCPSADRTSSAAANLATFVFTNVHPQQHELNAGPWEDLEKHARELVRGGKDLYIVAGGKFTAEPTRIGAEHKVAVPTNSWKVIVALPHGATLADVRGDAPTIAVFMPNQRMKDRLWVDFVKTIREIESFTHYDFDSKLPRDVQDVLEQKRQ